MNVQPPIVKILPSSFVCEEKVELVGDITIGSRTLIHPNVKILAIAGPIVIGENNIIEEQACIVNKFEEGEETHTQKMMIIGDNNLFEVGCGNLELFKIPRYNKIYPFIHVPLVSEALKVGDNNIIECKAKVGRDVHLKNGCIIGAKCVLNTKETLNDNTIIYGPDNQRRHATEKPQSQMSQLDFLTKLLPNYHKFKKPNVK